MFYGTYISGRLTDIGGTLPGAPNAVPLLSMASGYGPFSYDSGSMTAITVPNISQTVDERCQGISLPLRVLAALTVRASSNWSNLSSGRQSQVQGIIDAGYSGVVSVFT